MRSQNIYKILFIASMLMLAGQKAFPQKAFLFGADATIPKNDTVVVRLQEHVGEIQWQKTLELNGKDSWENIPDAITDSLVFIADTTTYFRAQVIAGHCDPFYSDTTFVNVYQQNENVVQINDEELELISDSTQLANGIYAYEGNATDIEIGSILVGSSGEGYMRIVTGIQSKSSSSVVLETEQAVLTDVVKNMQLSDSIFVTFAEDSKRYSKGKPIPVETFYLIPGAKLKSDKSGFDLSGVNFTIEVEDVGLVTATITHGHIDFQPIFHRELDISWIPARVNRFSLEMGGDIDFEMEVSIEAETGISVNKSISTLLAVVGPIPIGPVPMFLKLSLVTSLEAGLNISGEISFGFESDYSTSLGAAYVRDNTPEWSPIFNSDGSFNTKPFDFSFKANAYAMFGVAPKVDATIAGVAGPYLTLGPYLRGDLNAYWPLGWDFGLTAGIGGKLGFKVGILNRTLIDFYTSLPGPTWTIYETGGEYEHTVPEVETLPVTSITQTTAQCGGTVTVEGTSSVTARGVVWSTAQNPTLESNQGYTTNDSGIGEFESSLTGLTPSTTYYVKAYATNAEETGYGQQESFTTTTAGTPGNGVTDIEGNEYATVIIGTQEWMAENLKTTKYNNGSNIPNVTGNSEWLGLSSGAYCWYNNDEATYKDTYGALYNGYAVNTGNLCPTGWRVPTDAEWTQLIDYVVAQGYPNSGVVGGAGSALKSCRQVNSPMGGDCATSTHPRWNSHSSHYGTDVFGFSTLPGGYRYDTNGNFYDVGGFGNWWSSTELGATGAWGWYVGYYYEHMEHGGSSKRLGFSVRCLRDN